LYLGDFMSKYLLVVLALLLTGCEQEPPEKTVWDDQLKTMDKARDVEQQVLDAAEMQRKAMEEQTQQ